MNKEHETKATKDFLRIERQVVGTTCTRVIFLCCSSDIQSLRRIWCGLHEGRSPTWWERVTCWWRFCFEGTCARRRRRRRRWTNGDERGNICRQIESKVESIWKILLFWSISILDTENHHFVRGSIPVLLTSCLTYLDSAALLMLN